MILLTRRAVMPLAMAAALRAVPGRAEPEPDIGHTVAELYAGLESAMRAGRGTPFALRFDALAPVVDRVFDLDTVLRVSIGMRWDALDSTTQANLSRIYRRFTVATYVANFDKYEGERFEVIPGARDSGADRIVHTEMVASGGDRIRLDYVMRDVSGTWRAVDVLLDGSISRVAVQRSDFRKILNSGDADGLIASLRHKIADLSDGALNS
jgi:phospholipid transport system substrate-binding protein